MKDWSYKHLALLIAATLIWCKIYYSDDDDFDVEESEDFNITHSVSVAKKLLEEILK